MAILAPQPSRSCAAPVQKLRQMFETNTLGALRVIQAVLPAWRKRGSGVIVNVSPQVDDFSALLRSE
jgi:NADP-dependent 3-hydroxy acid dehydrogenase YdfG